MKFQTYQITIEASLGEVALHADAIKELSKLDVTQEISFG